MSGHPYSFGIEEEYFLADARTRGTPQGDLAAFHAEAKAGLPETGRELVAAQIELCTPPLAVMDEARRNLGGQRARLAMIAGRHGLTLLSCGTHPVARRESQTASDGERYQGILSDLGIAARRALICGMHVHIEVPDPDGRIDLMNRLLPFQPMLLALSASSPFWQGEATGLMAYRLSVFGELPRTGLPEIFADGGPCVPRSSTRPWSCGSPTPAPGSRIPSASRPCSAASCGSACAGPISMPASTASPGPSPSRTSGEPSGMASAPP